jgi:hypothetical protein
VRVTEDDSVQRIGREGKIDIEARTAFIKPGGSAVQQDAFSAGLY